MTKRNSFGGRRVETNAGIHRRKGRRGEQISEGSLLRWISRPSGDKRGRLYVVHHGEHEVTAHSAEKGLSAEPSRARVAFALFARLRVIRVFQAVYHLQDRELDPAMLMSCV